VPSLDTQVGAAEAATAAAHGRAAAAADSAALGREAVKEMERQIEEMGRLRTANEELLRRVQTSVEQRDAAVKAARDELNVQLSSLRKELLQVQTENALLMSQLVRRIWVRSYSSPVL
jgi:hypothetical protein